MWLQQQGENYLLNNKTLCMAHNDIWFDECPVCVSVFHHQVSQWHVKVWSWPLRLFALKDAKSQSCHDLNPPTGTCHDSWDLLTCIVASFKVKACLHLLSVCSLKMLHVGSLGHQLLTRCSATSKMHSPLLYATSIPSLILSYFPWCRWMPQRYKSQKQAVLLNAIHYFSCKKLTPSKRNYDVSNQEILAMKLSTMTKFHRKNWFYEYQNWCFVTCKYPWAYRRFLVSYSAHPLSCSNSLGHWWGVQTNCGITHITTEPLSVH